MNVLGSWLGQFMSIGAIGIVIIIMLIWKGVKAYNNIKNRKRREEDGMNSEQTETIIENPIRGERDGESNIKSNEEENNEILDVDLITREMIYPIAAHAYDTLKAINVRGVVYETNMNLLLQTPEGERILEMIHGDKIQSMSKKGIHNIKLPEFAIGIEVSIHMNGSATGATKTIDSYTIKGKFRGENRNPKGYWKVAPFMGYDNPLWTGIRPYDLDSVMRAVEKASKIMKGEGEDAIGMETERTKEKIHTQENFIACLVHLTHTFERLSHAKGVKIGSLLMDLLNDSPGQIEKLRKVCWEATIMTRELDDLLISLGEEIQSAIKIAQKVKSNRTSHEAFWKAIKKAKIYVDALNEMIRPLL